MSIRQFVCQMRQFDFNSKLLSDILELLQRFEISLKKKHNAHCAATHKPRDLQEKRKMNLFIFAAISFLLLEHIFQRALCQINEKKPLHFTMNRAVMLTCLGYENVRW